MLIIPREKRQADDFIRAVFYFVADDRESITETKDKKALIALDAGLSILLSEIDGPGLPARLIVEGKRSAIGEFIRGYFNWSIEDEGIEEFAPFDDQDQKDIVKARRKAEYRKA